VTPEPGDRPITHSFIRGPEVGPPSALSATDSSCCSCTSLAGRGLDTPRGLEHTASNLFRAAYVLLGSPGSSSSERNSLLEPHRSPIPSGKATEFPGRNPWERQRPDHVPDEERSSVLRGLTDTIQAGHHRLDPILDAISEAAQHLTGGTGSAVAMWKGGNIVCRARSGETAPPLGAILSADSGISGECLRTGEILHCDDTQADARVDPEVCRQLGLRSMAVLPIVGWHGINGILEVFSTRPHAFSEEHITLLKQLAALAEKARALQPHTASTVAEKSSERVPAFEPQTRSDRLRDVVLALIDSRWRPLVLGGAGALALLLIGFAIWLGFRTPDASDAKLQDAQQSPARSEITRPRDNDPIWRANPGGESLLKAKPSAGTSVQLAAKLDRIPEPKAPRVAAPFTADAAPATLLPQEAAASPVVEASTEPPSLDFNPPGTSALNDLATPAAKPTLALPISRGVSSGYLVHRVPPVYPPQALVTRTQGEVVLEAVISEDGTVEDLRAVKGPEILANAALRAVKQWRYKPYELNGKPVRIATNITVHFRLPE
jgi:TonB family protein